MRDINPLYVMLIGLGAFIILMFYVYASSIKEEKETFNKPCLANGGNVIRGRGIILCIKDGAIIDSREG